MGLLDMIRGRHEAQMVETMARVDTPSIDEKPHVGNDVNISACHPDQSQPEKVNPQAQPGIQKAEAAALVWSKKVVIGTYAWYARTFLRESYPNPPPSRIEPRKTD